MLISNDDQLRTYLPNTLTTVEGEQSLYDKMALYLRKAEAWLTRNFVGEVLMDAKRKRGSRVTSWERC